MKSAIDCAVHLAPANDSTAVLLGRLETTLQAIHLLPRRWTPHEAEIVAALANALSVLGSTAGYERVLTYLRSADWTSDRDRQVFSVLSDTLKGKRDLAGIYTETNYLALRNMPADRFWDLSSACTHFHKSGIGPADREDPKYIWGVISAISRLEGTKDSPARDAVIHNCEKTLLSQLLTERMKQTFLRSPFELSDSERGILDRFLAQIAPPPDADVAEQLATAFFAVPWTAEFSAWQKTNPKSSCEEFRGQSYLTPAGELWSIKCSFKMGSLQKELYFYPNAQGDAHTLQQIWFSYPSTSPDAVSALAGRMAQRLGPGLPLSEVFGPGAADWENILSWGWQGREVYVFRDIFGPRFGEGLPQVKIWAKDKELVSMIKQEEAAEQAIEREQEQQEVMKKERLYRDAAKSLPDLIDRLKRSSNPEEHFRLLLELLPKIAKKGPHRASQLYLADWLARSLADPIKAQYVKNPETTAQALSTYGVVYTSEYDGVAYNHAFLVKILTEGHAGYWADEAFLEWLVQGIGEEYGKDYSCDQPGRFKRVIAKGEDFLKRNPNSHIRQQLLLALAQAHETAWSFSLASPKDEFIQSENYQRGAQDHRAKALSYYQQFVKEFSHSSEAVLSRERHKRLRLGVDTNARHFFSSCH